MGGNHLCARTQGVGVNRPGAFAEYIVLPMMNVWKHAQSIPHEIAAIFDPFGKPSIRRFHSRCWERMCSSPEQVQSGSWRPPWRGLPVRAMSSSRM